jgi:FtsZ-interacting cell division protein ZipA
MISWGSLLHAQNNQPSQQPSQTQPPQQPPNSQEPPARSQQPDQQTPDQTQPSQDQAQPDASGSKEFVGTVMKQGDKYVLQEAASGTTYGIDHQDEVKKFEGKKVRVHGTLDPNTKTIHVQ